LAFGVAALVLPQAVSGRIMASVVALGVLLLVLVVPLPVVGVDPGGLPLSLGVTLGVGPPVSLGVGVGVTDALLVGFGVLLGVGVGLQVDELAAAVFPDAGDDC
jgi:hypothetical protein